MTEEQARRAADAILAAAALGAVYVVLRTPALRRMAWRLSVTAVTGMLPGWFAREVQHAWASSNHRTH
jgi:hypothetical protein